MAYRKVIVGYEEKIDRQRKLVDVVWKPEINLQETELPHQHVIKEEEEEKFVSEQDTNRTSSLDQQDTKPLWIKEEPEEVFYNLDPEPIEVKQETDAFLLAPYEESDESDEQDMSFSTYGVGIEEKSWIDIAQMNSVKSEADTDHQLISHDLQEAESQDQDGGEHGESGSAGNAGILCNTRTYDRPFKCHICGEDFRFKSFWSRHQKVHADRDPCICKVCGRTLYDASALKRHLRIHTGEKPYSCEVCGRDFRHRGGLEVHMRIHRDEKPFPCETCGKSFRCLGVLNAHMKIHTGERPYVCQTCDKGFCEMSALKRHMRSHTGEKPYDCKICGRDFRYRSGIQGHMKRVHPGEVETL